MKLKNTLYCPPFLTLFYYIIYDRCDHCCQNAACVWLNLEPCHYNEQWNTEWKNPYKQMFHPWKIHKIIPLCHIWLLKYIKCNSKNTAINTIWIRRICTKWSNKAIVTSWFTPLSHINCSVIGPFSKIQPSTSHDILYLGMIILWASYNP